MTYDCSARSAQPKPRKALRRRAPWKPPSLLHPHKRYPATPEAYEALKEAIWERSGGRCEMVWDAGRCPIAISRESMEPHHIVKRSEGGPDSLANILAVCHECHKRIHGNELHWSGGRIA